MRPRSWSWKAWSQSRKVRSWSWKFRPRLFNKTLSSTVGSTDFIPTWGKQLVVGCDHAFVECISVHHAYGIISHMHMWINHLLIWIPRSFRVLGAVWFSILLNTGLFLQMTPTNVQRYNHITQNLYTCKGCLWNNYYIFLLYIFKGFNYGFK